MTTQRRERPYEVLVRYGLNEAGQLTVSAHQARIVEFVDTATGKVESASAGLPTALAAADVADVVGEMLPGLIAERDALQADLTAQAAAHAAEVQALTADHAAEVQATATAHAQALAAETSAKTEALEAGAATAASLATMTAARDALQARVDELTAPASDGPVISKLQAVLVLDETAAPGFPSLSLYDVLMLQLAQAPRRIQLYWENTTALHRRHPELLNMQATLGWSDVFVDGLFAAGATKT